jgi:hypothetical protein
MAIRRTTHGKHTLALEAMELGHPKARWLTAAAYDRWLMYQGKPQKYGTNYVTDGVRHRLWDVDPATMDTERAAWDVPSLAEQLRKAEEATRIDPPGPVNLDAAPWWLKEALVRWGMLDVYGSDGATGASTFAFVGIVRHFINRHRERKDQAVIFPRCNLDTIGITEGEPVFRHARDCLTAALNRIFVI